MSLGKAVVATTVGAQGIGYTDGHNLLIADTPQQFVDQIQRCIADPDFCKALGRNAQDFIAQAYGVEGLTQRLIAFYEKHLNLE